MERTESTKKAPSRWWYLLAVMIMLLGPVYGIYNVLSTSTAVHKAGKYFITPGALKITVNKPETYILWNAKQTIYQGQSYKNDGSIPAMKILVMGKRGKAEEFDSDLSMTAHFGEEHLNSIGKINFTEPGTYQVMVIGDYPDRVFYLNSSNLVWVVMKGILLFFLYSAITLIAGIAMIVVVAMKRSRAMKSDTPQTSIIGAEGAGELESTSDATASEAVLKDRITNTASICHFSVLLNLILPIPFLNIILPLIVWSMKKNMDEFIDYHGKEAINFQISILIYTILSILLCLIVIGFFLLVALFFFNIIAVIVAGISAAKGERFHYPLCIRFIK
ncbi:MAG: hypothetical protein CMF50_08785 [Legionellales bacterium]|nr:hypothetical protein [Legionellales bacterium]|tara:strand:+ start:2948 stop:3946 length:999 start_codon:yes stop_codon:yes gene_type:complete